MDSAFGKNCLHLDEIIWPRREKGDGVMLIYFRFCFVKRADT